MPRPAHYAEYENLPEVVPGVFLDAGTGVYIVDDEGEVVSWNSDEWEEDPLSVTATVVAALLAAMKGAAAVRRNIGNGTEVAFLVAETEAKRKRST